jgi:hypothetical protein
LLDDPQHPAGRPCLFSRRSEIKAKKTRSENGLPFVEGEGRKAARRKAENNSREQYRSAQSFSSITGFRDAFPERRPVVLARPAKRSHGVERKERDREITAAQAGMRPTVERVRPKPSAPAAGAAEWPPMKRMPTA